LIDAGVFLPEAMHRPAEVALAALLEDRLAAVVDRGHHVGGSDDAAVLHEFRVALRRLRSLIRVYGPLLEDVIRLRLRRELRRVARATNASRDLDVKLEWLSTQKAALRPRDEVGLRWLIGQLEEARRQADAEAHALIARRLDRVVGDVGQRVARLGRRTGSPESLAPVTAHLLQDLAREIEKHLDKVRTIEDQLEAHAARIAGKRVRYLLEPLSGLAPTAGPLIARLKELQDLLGEMHDAEVAAGMIADAMETAAAERGQRVAKALREAGTLDRAALRRARRRDPMPGLIALAARLQARREAAWETLAADWLPRRGELLVQPLEELAHWLATQEGEPLEVERKYLLSGFPPHAGGAPVLEVEQGYIPGQVIGERLRRVQGPDGVRCYRTIKLGAGVVRQEFEEPASVAVFEAMWPLTEGHRLRKRRYLVPHEGLTWEIDQFTDRPLVLAEVELPPPGEAPELPAWLVPWVVREVTDDPAYLNSSLAR
jgi:CHAD domain-containing protein/CYTH domain-containing protein